MNDFLFTFVTPEKEIAKQVKVKEILCPSETGELNILPQHAPLMALLKPGVLSYKVANKWEKFAVSWGYLEVHPKGVRVLAETAETGVEISKLKSEQKIEELSKKLEDPLLTQEQIREIKKQIEKEEVRIHFSNTN